MNNIEAEAGLELVGKAKRFSNAEGEFIGYRFGEVAGYNKLIWQLCEAMEDVVPHRVDIVDKVLDSYHFLSNVVKECIFEDKLLSEYFVLRSIIAYRDGVFAKDVEIDDLDLIDQLPFRAQESYYDNLEKISVSIGFINNSLRNHFSIQS